MTKARRRVLQLALMLKAASIEPVFVGDTYRDWAAGMEIQLAEIPRGRLKTLRRKVRRIVSGARGLEKAGDGLVPRPPIQQGSPVSEPTIGSSLQQETRQEPETPRCDVCRMRSSGRRKRSFPNLASATRVLELQRDPGLAAYPCPASGDGMAWHLGHTHKPKSVSSAHPTTKPYHRELQYMEIPMLPKPLHKEPKLNLRASLANPLKICIYSVALLLMGCAVGMHWNHRPATALCVCIAGGVLMAAHDLAVGVLMFTITARWVRAITLNAHNRG